MIKEYKILLVEDDSVDVEIIKKQLQRAGMKYDMKVVSNKSEFIEAVSNTDFDVVLCDHSMSQLSSHEILKACKAQNAHLPFILVTGNASEELASDIIKEGADDYVLKDNLTRLPSAIITAISNHQNQFKKELVEKELLETNKFLSLLIKTIPDMFFVINKEGIFLDYKADEKDLYTTPDQFLGKKLTAVMPAGVSAKMLEQVQRTITLKAAETVEYQLAINNEERELEARCFPFGDDKALVMVRNITQEKAMQAKLENERKFHNVLVENINVGVFAVNNDREIILANETFKNLFGINAQSNHLMEVLTLFDVYKSDGKTRMTLKEMPLIRALNMEVTNNMDYFR